MKQLKTLLKGVQHIKIIGSQNPTINNIHFDSRKVEPKDLFFAVKGTLTDGHKYIQSVIGKGARVIICEDLPTDINQTVTYVKVDNCSDAMGLIAANYYGNPTKKIKIVGVTGTNGKTTTVTLLHQIFRRLGYNVGLFSTVKNKINETAIPSTHTTPDAIQLNQLFKRMVDENCQYCFMEVSSHAIHQKRIAGVQYEGAVFTNITHDHLDYHLTFDAYLEVKKEYLNSLKKPAFVICNIDDPNGLRMVDNLGANLKTISTKKDADFSCKVVKDDLTGLTIELDGKEIKLQLLGNFNAYNILTAYAVALSLGEKKSDILKLLPQLTPIEGRFDYVQSVKNVIGVVDFAHTPDALINIYSTLSKLKTEKLITVVGCGGDRDKEKRPEMAKIAYDNSDLLILTSDNPRSEDPAQIINEMLSGIQKNTQKVKVIIDRKEAIEFACSNAKINDIVLVAGKGHEKYQEIQGVKYDFDDKTTLMEALNT
jgi:UDP-N-acetylmuramoyl-L-alanyl-D-glutamate--2,6-diaminopimelate ligase